MDVRIQDLFGSDSDAEEPGARQPEKPARDNDDRARTREEEMKVIFGSDDEEDDARPGPSGVNASAAGYYEDGYQRESTPPEDEDPRPVQGPPLRVEVALHDVLAPEPLRLAKLSNVLAIEPRPFDPDTFEPEAAEYVDERGRKRVRLGDNAMRWRWAAAPDGALRREANARLVRWSDGSCQLAVGDEFFDAREIEVGGDQGFLFARHPNLIQGQGRLERKMVFRPASLTSGSHRRLAAAVDRQQAAARTQRVRATTTLLDPKKLKEERERAEEVLIRDKERLAERQQRQMRKYTGAGAASGGGAPRYHALSAAYLEEDEQEDDGFIVRDEELSGEEGAGYGGGRRRAMGAEEEAEAGRRLAAAKAGGGPAAGAGLKRRAALADSEDEDISGEDEELKGFIVEEEEERGERRAEAPPPAKKRRAVVFDSDSE